MMADPAVLAQVQRGYEHMKTQYGQIQRAYDEGAQIAAPTAWTHQLTSTETGIARDLLWGVWRLHGDDALTRWVLATVLTELGVRLREAGLEQPGTTQRLIDMGGWLNAPKDCPWTLEPPPVVRVPWWRRWRRTA